MRPITRALVLAAALLAPATASAQKHTHHVCLVMINVADKVLFVGRQIIEVRNSQVAMGDWAAWPDQDFEARVRGLYSREDMDAGPNRVSAGGYFQPMSIYANNDARAAKTECLRRIERFRGEGYDVYGVGSPLYSGHDDDEVREIGFLSATEFGDYVPGTIAAKARREGSSGGATGGATGSSGGTSGRDDSRSFCERWPGDWNCMSPAQQAQITRMRTEQATSHMNRGDAYWDARRYPEALEAYRRALVLRRWLTDEQDERANERIRQYTDNASTMEYARFNDETGIAFGGAWGQSHLMSDGGLFGATMRIRAGGLGPWITWAGSFNRLSHALGHKASLEGEGEMTRYALTLGAPVPKLHGDKFGIHAGYTYQKTEARTLNLLTTGVYVGSPTGLSMRLDVTPVYGKPKFGVGMIFDFGGN